MVQHGQCRSSSSSRNNTTMIETLVTPGAAALAAVNASNESFKSKRDLMDDEFEKKSLNTDEIVREASLKAKARVAEERRKREMRDDSTRLDRIKGNIFKQKKETFVRLRNPNERILTATAETAVMYKKKNGLQMEAQVIIPYETTSENKHSIGVEGVDIGATCICALPLSKTIACGRENGCVDIAKACGALDVQKKMNPAVKQQRLELDRICENVAKKSSVRSMRLSTDFKVLAIGFDNGAFVKIIEPSSFEEKGVTAESCVLQAYPPPQEAIDIFKRVAGGKLLGPHVSRKANCRTQVISKDLDALFFGSPVFRDGSFFVTREVYKNKRPTALKKVPAAAKKEVNVPTFSSPATAATHAVTKGFFNKPTSSKVVHKEEVVNEVLTLPIKKGLVLEELDDDFEIVRDLDAIETEEQIKEMYDILNSDLSEKEQTEALNRPYKKKKKKKKPIEEPVKEKEEEEEKESNNKENAPSPPIEQQQQQQNYSEKSNNNNNDNTTTIKDGEEEIPTIITQRFSAHAHPVQSLIFLDEEHESTLISGANDKTVAFWDLEKAFSLEADDAINVFSPRFKFNAGTEVRAMVTSKQGNTLYLAGADKCVHMFELRFEFGFVSGALRKRTFPCHHEGFITTLSLSQDNTRLFTGSEHSDIPNDGYLKRYNSGDSTICVWDVSTGEATDIARKHNGTVTQILVGDDEEETIHTSALDGCVHRWKRSEHGKIRLAFDDARLTTAEPTYGFRKGFL